MARAFGLSAPSVAGCLKMQCGQQKRKPRLFGGHWERQPCSRRRIYVVMCARAGVDVWMRRCGCVGAHVLGVHMCACVCVRQTSLCGSCALLKLAALATATKFCLLHGRAMRGWSTARAQMSQCIRA